MTPFNTIKFYYFVVLRNYCLTKLTDKLYDKTAVANMGLVQLPMQWDF